MALIHKRTDPTAQDLDYARRFGAWQKAARGLKKFSIPQLAKVTGYSESQVRMYDEDARGGVDITGRYRRPKEFYVEAVAQATGADYQLGLVESGLVLPSIEYGEELDAELIHLYASASPSEREMVKAMLRTARQMERDSGEIIGGKKAE